MAGAGTFLVVVLAAFVSSRSGEPVGIPHHDRTLLIGLLTGMWAGVVVAGLVWVFSRRLPGAVKDTATVKKRGASTTLLVQAGVGTFLIVLLVCAFCSQTSTPWFFSTAKVRINSGKTDAKLLEKELALIQSDAFLGKVVLDLNLKIVWGNQYYNGRPLSESWCIQQLHALLRTRSIPETNLIAIDAVNQKSAEAASLANGIANRYLREARETKVEILEEAKPSAHPYTSQMWISRGVWGGILMGLLVSGILWFVSPNASQRSATSQLASVTEFGAEDNRPPAISTSGLVEAQPFSTAGPFGLKRRRTIELALVCLVAFGYTLIPMIFYVFGLDEATERTPTSSAASSSYHWLGTIVHESTALSLLWYLLRLHGRKFADLGLRWNWKDFVWFMPLWILTGAISSFTYRILNQTGFTTVDYGTASSRVANYLFGNHVAWVAILAGLLNPFYEELIVRGYLMTEIKYLTKSAFLAVMISTIFQTSYHFYQGLPMALSAGASFLIFSLFYAKTNKLAPIVLTHIFADVGGALSHMFRHH